MHGCRHGCYDGGGGGAGEHVSSSAVSNQCCQSLADADETALDAQGLAGRSQQDVRSQFLGQTFGDATPGGPDSAYPVGVVNDGQGAVTTCDPGEVSNGSDVTSHGVDPLREHDGSFGGDVIKGMVDGIEVSMRDDDRARPSQPAPVDEAGMVIRIGDDGDVRTCQQLHGRDICLIAAGHEDCPGIPQPCGDLVFSMVVCHRGSCREA